MNIFESLNNLEVSEACFEDIIALVEELIFERNKENRRKKKEWELNRTSGTGHPMYSGDKKKGVARTERTIKNLQKIWSVVPTQKDKGRIDYVARSNRIALGREQNPVSIFPPDNYEKAISKKLRTEHSQRGSIKDPNSI